MIKGLQTNQKRCPFQLITRIVNANVADITLDDGTVAKSATLQEQKTEFGECLKNSCMAYHEALDICLKIIPIVQEISDGPGDSE